MTVAFYFDPKSYRDYAKQLRLLAKKHKVASAGLLNEQAFEARKEALAKLGRLAIVRSPAFASRQMRVEKARVSPAMGFRQQAEMGSIKGPRFTGWKELEFGGEREKRLMPAGRIGGSKTRRMRGPARMKPGANHPSPGDAGIRGAQDENHRAVIFLQMLSRKRFKKHFVIHGHKKLKSGLYRFKGRAPKQKLQMVQSFDRTNVKRIRWMKRTINKLISTFPIRSEWGRQWRRLIKST